jgi:hypothetical protein
MDENSSVSTRSVLEVGHFALCAAGLLVAATGVVINCVLVAFGGAFLLAWGLLFFLAIS